MKTLKNSLHFLKRKLFLYFTKQKPLKNFRIFLKESFSYISGNGNPEKILYITGNGNPNKLIFQAVTFYA